MESKILVAKFEDFFRSKDHLICPPAPLIPADDTSVLFTTAGMQQFKRFYIEPGRAPARRLITIQPCLRTSDIEEVGDATHLTYFKMLGHFSFGDYFKKETIEWTYELLTKVLDVPKERISIRVFEGDATAPFDKESFLDWSRLLPQERVRKGLRKDNFWGPAGAEGPCGVCNEVYLDGIEVATLVFMEYYCRSDKTLKPLAKRGVDVGWGLERLAMMLQKKESVFETDLYKKFQIKNSRDYRILLDHLRASEALADEGLVPSNKEHGYILRRLIRRMLVICKRHHLNFSQITNNQILLDEDKKFNRTLKNGLHRLDKLEKISGEDLFDLYQSYGFPVELSIEEAGRQKIAVEKDAEKKFQSAFREHQDLSRTSAPGMFKGGLVEQNKLTTKHHTVTHLLLAALNKILGDSIYQRGSNITAERLRFDFNFDRKLTNEKIKKIEDLVNDWIRGELPVEKEEMTVEEAKRTGAIGAFGEKYNDKVFVYTIAKKVYDNQSGARINQIISREICAGPHVKNTRELGHFKIIKEESSSAGIRRIKAVLE